MVIFAVLHSGCNIRDRRRIDEVMTPESHLERNTEDGTLAVAAAAVQRDALGELYRRHQAAVQFVFAGESVEIVGAEGGEILLLVPKGVVARLVTPRSTVTLPGSADPVVPRARGRQ